MSAEIINLFCKRKCPHGVPILDDCLACEDDLRIDREMMRVGARLLALEHKLRDANISATAFPRAPGAVTCIHVQAPDGRAYRVEWDAGIDRGFSIHWGTKLVADGTPRIDDVVSYFRDLRSATGRA